MKNKVFVFLCAFGVTLCSCSVFSAEPVAGQQSGDSTQKASISIAVMDVKKIFSESPQVAEMRTKLKNQFDPRGKEIENLQKDLQSNVDNYNKNASVMKDQEKKDLHEKIIDQQTKLKEMQTDFQKNVVAAEDQSMQVITKKIQEVVDKIAKQKKLDLVLTNAAVGYRNPSMDITDEVVKAMKEKATSSDAK